MTNTITLPPMIGTREAASELIAEAGLATDLHDERVVIYGHELLTATPSFVDELVKRLLERHVGSVALVGSPSKFLQDMKSSGRRREFDNIAPISSTDV